MATQPPKAPQIDLGMGYKDWTRVAWTFVAGMLAYAASAALDIVGGQPWTWDTLKMGALAAAVSLVKNFVLADTSTLK